MEPAPQTMVTSSVRLLEKLGEGGMGSVWVAEHLGLSSRVAVKFVATDIVRRHPALVERFKREAGVAARIKCPHVVQVLDHGLTEDGTPYIVMELLEGETLAHRMLRDGAIGLRHTALIVSQTAQVLARAHELGVVHRDIKPANIFLTRSDYEVFVKVLDFGIAKYAELFGDVSVTSTGTMLGSPLYMSPEQFVSAKDVDGRADLWSLSVIAYQALCGRPAFEGDTLGKVMMSVMSRAYVPPATVDPRLPSLLNAWFAKAFAEQVDQRFQTADDLARSFVEIANELLTTGFRVDHAAAPSLGRTGSALLRDADIRPRAATDSPRAEGAGDAISSSLVGAAGASVGASAVSVAEHPRRRPLLWAVAAVGLIAVGAGAVGMLAAGSTTDAQGSTASEAPPGTAQNASGARSKEVPDPYGASSAVDTAPNIDPNASSAREADAGDQGDEPRAPGATAAPSVAVTGAPKGGMAGKPDPAARPSTAPTAAATSEKYYGF